MQVRFGTVGKDVTLESDGVAHNLACMYPGHVFAELLWAGSPGKRLAPNTLPSALCKDRQRKRPVYPTVN